MQAPRGAIPEVPSEPAGRTMRDGSHRARGDGTHDRTPISTSPRCSPRNVCSSPPEAFAARAVVQDRSIYERAEADHEAFWAEQADRLGWVKRWDTVMTWTPPWVKWFEGGQLNASYNCLDRHVEAGGGDKVAYYWEGEPGEERAITYRDLLRGGLPVRERPQGRSACARATGSRSTWAWSPSSRRDARLRADRRAALGRVRRLLSAEALQRPHQRRRGQGLDHRRRRLPPRRRRAAEGRTPTRRSQRVPDHRARRHGPADRRRARVHRGARPLVPRAGRRPADRVRARADGRRGPALPAVHERHHRQAQGHRAHDRRLPHAGGGDAPDDLRHPRGRRVLVRGRHRVGDRPLVHRVRAAREPHHGHHLRGRAGLARQGPPVGDRREVRGDDPVHGAHGDPRVHAVGHASIPQTHDLSSLRLLGSVGEPINPEAWIWYWTYIGGERCPIVDTWWQTETGAILITPLPGHHRRSSPARRRTRSRASRPTSSTSRGVGAARRRRLPRAEAARGPRSPRRSAATRTATSRPTSRKYGPETTSPATAPSGTRTGTSGCSAASTT